MLVTEENREDGRLFAVDHIYGISDQSLEK